MENAAGGLEIEGHGAVVEDTAPAFHKPNKFVAVVQDALTDDSPDYGVQAGAISAAGQHSNAHFEASDVAGK